MLVALQAGNFKQPQPPRSKRARRFLFSISQYFWHIDACGFAEILRLSKWVKVLRGYFPSASGIDRNA
jgi:hypothetical protein